VGRWVNDVPRERNKRDAHWTGYSPSIRFSPPHNNPTTLLPMSSVTFFESSDCENTQQFWEGASVEQTRGQRQTGRNDLPDKGEKVASGW